MGKKSQSVWVVLYPNGEKATGGVSPISEDHAWAGALKHWLHDEWFGGVEWGHQWGGGALYHFVPALLKRGWKVIEVDLAEIRPDLFGSKP